MCGPASCRRRLGSCRFRLRFALLALLAPRIVCAGAPPTRFVRMCGMLKGVRLEARASSAVRVSLMRQNLYPKIQRECIPIKPSY